MLQETLRSKRPRLLIVADWFAPAVRAGGPVRSCVNLVEELSATTDIAVLTGDRDLGIAQVFDNVKINKWNNWNGKARVFYASKAFQLKAFSSLVKQFHPDAVYLNSMFSPALTILPLLTQRRWAKNCRVVLAPRGMLKPSALNQKRFKKSSVLNLLRRVRCTKNLVFHATSDAETEEIAFEFGTSVEIRKIANIPLSVRSKLSPLEKQIGRCRLCFVGRIHPVKNLLHFLKQLRLVSGDCHLDVVGPLEDAVYTEACQAMANELPSNISVSFLGARSPDEVCKTIGRAHATVLPTLGENFGHAIFESFALGVPALISDQTIWRDLQMKSAGWDIPLSSDDGFARVVDQICGFDQGELQSWRCGAQRLANDFLSQSNLRDEYTSMFFGAKR